jgi:8-oxo-dGTP diphosphatase
LLGRVEFHSDEYETWGVLPIYRVEVSETDLSVEDPDAEITDAAWFESLPEDTRDRDVLSRWLETHLEE